MATQQFPSTAKRGSIRLACLAAASIVLLQAGCAAVKTPGFLLPGPSSDSSATNLTKPQVELKLALAKAAERRGDISQALSAYQDLVDTGLGSAEVHHRLALIYDRKGNSLQAEKHYLASLKENPTDAKVLCDYGYSLYLRESWEAAETQFRQAIEADPQYLRSRVNLGMLLARTERVDQGLQQFALGGLSEGAAHHNVALAATENGDTQTAAAALKVSQLADRGLSSSGNHHALGQVVERMAAWK